MFAENVHVIYVSGIHTKFTPARKLAPMKVLTSFETVKKEAAVAALIGAGFSSAYAETVAHVCATDLRFGFEALCVNEELAQAFPDFKVWDDSVAMEGYGDVWVTTQVQFGGITFTA